MPAEQVLFDFAQIGIGNPVIQAGIIGLIRGVAGWVENVIQDGKITRFELKQLGATMFRILPQALGLGAALGPAGAASALFTDWAIVKGVNAVKKKKK